MPSPRTRVLLIDDHPVVLTGNRRVLEDTEDLQVVGEGENGEEGYQLYCELRPDVVVMDLSMPGMGGLEAIRRILARDDAARVLVFTMHDNEAMLSQAMKLGARGYLTKRASAEELVTAVRKVARDNLFVESEVLSNAVGAERTTPPGLAELSPREFQVFRLLADGYRVPDIAEFLSISPKTVGVHRARVMQKLGTRSTVQLVRLALAHGVVSL